MRKVKTAESDQNNRKLAQMLPVAERKVSLFREKMLQVLRVLEILRVYVLGILRVLSEISTFSTADTCGLAVFRGPTQLWILPVLVKYFSRVLYCG